MRTPILFPLGQLCNYLRESENIEKRYYHPYRLLQPGAFETLSVGLGTPKGWADAAACGEGHHLLYLLPTDRGKHLDK